MLAVGKPAVEHRLMLLLVGGATEHETVLHPDAHAADVEAGLLECPAEVEAFGVRMEDVSRSAFRYMRRHIAERSQKKFVELLVCHAVVLDGLAIGRFIVVPGKVYPSEVRMTE